METANEVQVITPQTLTLADVKKYFCPLATEKEVVMFLQIAKSCNLNPFLKEIYLVKYGEEPATILTSYNVYLQRAERSGAYAGLETETQGSVSTNDLKAIVKVFRKDWQRPLIHEVYYDEYVQRRKDGTPNRFWKEKPRTMIVKVAISQAFRLAFPLDFQGMPYTMDEINDVPQIQIEPEKQETEKFSPPPKVNSIEEDVRNINQEELTALINTAIMNKYTPAQITRLFEQLGYKLSAKMSKSFKIENISPSVVVWDFETILDEVSNPKGESDDTKK